MTEIEKKRIEAELMRVTAARMELEIRHLELMENADRTKAHIDIQITKEQELKDRLNNK